RLVSLMVKGGVRYYSFERGGFFSASSEKLAFAINAATGELESFSAINKVARWELSDGWHSGPIKVTHDDFDTGPLTRGGAGMPDLPAFQKYSPISALIDVIDDILS